MRAESSGVAGRKLWGAARLSGPDAAGGLGAHAAIAPPAAPRLARPPHRGRRGRHRSSAAPSAAARCSRAPRALRRRSARRPPATPESVLAQCAPMGAAAFGTCTNAGRDQLCDISVTAQPRAGWVFRRWAPQSNRCPGATNPVCTFRTREIDCDAAGEHCTVNEPGPFRLIAEFADRRAPTVALTGGPRAGETVFDDARRVAFAFTTDENDEAPTFQLPARRRAAGGLREPAHARRRPGRPASVLRHRHRRVGQAERGAGVSRAGGRRRRRPVELLARPPAATTATAAAFTYRSNKAGHPDDGATLELRVPARRRPVRGVPRTRASASKGSVTDGTSSRSATRFRAVGVERVSAAATHDWSVDTTPPETTITSGPPDGATIVDVAPDARLRRGRAGRLRLRGRRRRRRSPARRRSPRRRCRPARTPSRSRPPTRWATSTRRPRAVTFTLVTGLATLRDADGDGVPEALDCDDRDAGVRPGGLERPRQRRRRELRRRAARRSRA